MIVDVIKKSKIKYSEIAKNTGIDEIRLHNIVHYKYKTTQNEEQKILKYLLERCLQVEQMCKDRII